MVFLCDRNRNLYRGNRKNRRGTVAVCSGLNHWGFEKFKFLKNAPKILINPSSCDDANGVKFVQKFFHLAFLR
jgi:hypothetical protein